MSKKAYVNKFRRRIEQVADQFLIAASRLSATPPLINPYDNSNPRVSLITVNYNTLELAKLMLLTFSELISGTTKVQHVVVVDNGSKDGSLNFFQKFTDSSIVKCVRNKGLSNHASGLRFGINHIANIELKTDVNKRTNLYLIVDSDIIFLKNPLPTMINQINEQEAGLIGEIQYDVGEPYAHPSCFLLRRDCYEDPRIWPFVNHGAPALWLQQSMKKAGMDIIDFPVRSDDYILHRGRGAAAGIRTYSPRHSYATIDGEAHFHGNPDGKKYWDSTINRLNSYLLQTKESEAVRYIESHLS